MIRRCDDRDFELIWAIINDGAHAYKGIIPADRWTDPYMSRKELRHEIDEGVVFWGFEEAEVLVGVMGLQQVQDVTLIRHAYVRTSSQKRGTGGHLLSHLRGLTRGPVLIGTWADAVWAIQFYERYGFQKSVRRRRTGCSRSIGPFPNAKLKPPWFWRMRNGGNPIRRNARWAITGLRKLWANGLGFQRAAAMLPPKASLMVKAALETTLRYQR